jgi:SNF2 family DNA or RNA helicase
VAHGTIDEVAPRLYAHQLEAFERSCDAEAFALFHEMGLGKTLVAIMTADHLAARGKIDAALVVAPKGAYRNWSELEVPKWTNTARAAVHTWSSNATRATKDGKTTRTARVIDAAIADRSRFLWLAINVEAVRGERGAAFLERFLESRRALVIVDEATTIKNPKAKQAETMLRFRHLAAYRRVLTGTPITKSPLDLYAPMLWLDPKILGVMSWYAMRGAFCVLGERVYTEWDPKAGKRVERKKRTVVGYKRLEELQRRIAPFSDRRTKEECLDLPPKTYLRREVELEPEQRKIYDRMALEARVELGAPGFEVSAPAVIAKIVRLHQIACGHLPRPDGSSEIIAANRIAELLELLEEVDGKAIIWANYVTDLARIRDALDRAYGKGAAVIYAGQTPDKERPRIVEAFQSPGGPRWFVGEPKTGGYSVTLTAAQTVVYYSNRFDLEIRLQSEDRAHRIGQRGTVTYVDLVAPDTVDEKIIDALRAKKNLADLVLGDRWREWI